MSKIPLLEQLEKDINETKKRNLDGTLEQCKEELRDAYMNFKDLQQRCVIDLKQEFSTDSEDKSHKVFYFKPDTFLLDDAEKQNQFRDALLKRVGHLPQPEPISYLGDDLHRQMCQTVGDRSHPRDMKKMLCQFYKRRQYCLQHLKYKLLLRWAHYSFNQETMEKLSLDATFIYAKLDMNIEYAIQRADRLTQNDYFEEMKPSDRPSTQANVGAGSLYVEKFDITPQSLIREDDIEVYLRATTYRNKVNRVVNKFISRAKWVAAKDKYKMYEKAVEHYFNLRQENISRQKSLVDQVRTNTLKANVMTADLKKELDHILSNYYISNYERIFLNNSEKILHSWRANHDEVPQLIRDQMLLKLKITQLASEYHMGGDIELDGGFSFTYQVTAFFPTYFTKQIAKSQFSLYDCFGEDVDPNENLKISLSQMAHIDTNLFKDITTEKQAVPDEQDLKFEFKKASIKIMRLKSAEDWLRYVCLKPVEPDWLHKQDAVVRACGEVDKLLEAAIDFLDMNDTATISRIIEDQSTVHQENVKKLLENDQHSFHQTVRISTMDGDKKMKVDTINLNNSLQEGYQLEKHILPHLQHNYQNDETTNTQTENIQPKPFLRHLPSHLLSCYGLLRFMKSRDYKIKLMYVLNYFRSVQKRFAIDLREFATRDRIDGAAHVPFTQSQEANTTLTNRLASHAKQSEHRHQAFLREQQMQASEGKKLTVFDPAQIQSVKDMATLRFYKVHGLFNTRVFHTCPGLPRFHAAHGEPLTHQNAQEQPDMAEGAGVTEQAIRLVNRIDFVEFNLEAEEVYIKDDMGIYIMYDCVLQDMRTLEAELLHYGSYFLHKSEQLLDPESRPVPTRDRQGLLLDLLQKEASFQFEKALLMQSYLECYEHITDPLEQQRLMQTVTDIMGRRPRLNLHANYFADAYDAEILCLRKQRELVELIVTQQINLEKTENKRLQDSLGLSYELAALYAKNRWKYQDAEQLLQAFEKAKKQRERDAKEQKRLAKQVEQEVQQAEKQSDSKYTQSRKSSTVVKGDSEMNRDSQADHSLSAAKKKIKDELSSEEEEEILSESDNFNEDPNKFTALLGLPRVSIDTIYQNYRERDQTVLGLMREHSNFIQCHEGYPEFLTQLAKGSILEQNILYKNNPWGQAQGILDFYDSLDVINKVHAVQVQAQQELYDKLKVWDTSLMTFLDIELVDQLISQMHQVVKFMDGTETEYEGRDLVEDETVCGNADSIIFNAKEMVAQVSSNPLNQLNPFIVCKLDVPSVYAHEFPTLKQEENKYSLRKKGLSGADFIARQEKAMLAGLAKARGPEVVEEQLKRFIGNRLKTCVGQNERRVRAPTLLQVYCNTVEFLRIRNEIIQAVSETTILAELYRDQCKLIGEKNDSTEFTTGILFKEADEEGLIDYCEDGPAHQDSVSLAIKEFDPAMLSNFNFRNPDSLRLSILTSGLEEARAILQYQVLQKQLLIVATRINAQLIDAYERSLSELTIIEQTKLLIPNTVFEVGKLVNKATEQLKLTDIKQLKVLTKSQCSQQCKNVFYMVKQKKNQSRSQVTKEYQTYKAQAQAEIKNANSETIGRIMRCFRVKLINRFVQQTLTEVYLDAQKVQALEACSRLRVYNRMFNFEPSKLQMQGAKQTLFKCETSKLLENFTWNYLPDEFRDDHEVVDEFKCLNLSEYKVTDLNGIPSSYTLLSAEACPIEDTRLFRQKRKDLREKLWPEFVENEEIKDQPVMVREPEEHLKRHLPSFTPDLAIDMMGGKKEELDSEMQKRMGTSGSSQLDYAEALYFGDSHYARMTRYYLHLERIISLEWYIRQLEFSAPDAVHFSHAIETGLPFFHPDEFEQRVQMTVKDLVKDESQNKFAQDVLFDQIVSHRNKQAIASAVQSLGLIMRNLLDEYSRTKAENKVELLTQYCEFRYQQIVGTLHKLSQTFYEKHNLAAVRKVQHAITKMTKMDHIDTIPLGSGNYIVNGSATQAYLQNLESTSLTYSGFSHDEQQSFLRAVQPVMNERKLEPPELTLFQAIYQIDPVRRGIKHQYCGYESQFTSPFTDLTSCLLGLTHEERQLCRQVIVLMKYQAGDFMESVYDDNSMQSQTENDVYSLHQLRLGKKFINESTSALLLKQALICWSENSLLPTTAEQYLRYEENFRINYFWKQVEMKDELYKKRGMGASKGKPPSKQELERLKERIDKLMADNTLPTEDACKQRDLMVAALREEFKALKKKVTLDGYFGMKAQIAVYANEIEKLIIKASVATLDQETRALAKCFTTNVPSIQYHIHPFQQFAATHFDTVDPNSNIDLANRVNAVQELLTRTRNRATEVETLTSGPGIVITIKDLNEILIDFCRSTINEQAQSFKSRNEAVSIKENHFKQLLYLKDQKIKNMEQRFTYIGLNLDSIIASRLFEKGNQLVYELDASNRVLKIFKKAMSQLEESLTHKIQSEQLEKFKRQANKVEMKDQKFNDYINNLVRMIGADFASEQDRIGKILKEIAEKGKALGEQAIWYKRSQFYPKTELYPETDTKQSSQGVVKDNDNKRKGNKKQEETSVASGAYVPKGFEHYPHCVCYQPNPQKPRPTLEHAELDMLSEQEARQELHQMCTLVRQQRLLYRTKEMCMMSKFQKRISQLENAQHQNQLVWEQLQESEKRERVLRQELSSTQSSFNQAQLQIEKQLIEIKSLEQEKQRLLKFKASKVDRLRDLEDKVKKNEILNNVDGDKLIHALTIKTNQVNSLQQNQQNFDKFTTQLQNRNASEIRKLKTELFQEKQKSSQIIEKMDQLKLELKMLEQNDSSVTSIWKKKCLDLFEVCTTVQQENEELRERCKDLIEQGLNLANQMQTGQSLMSEYRESTIENTMMMSPPVQRSKGLPELGSAQAIYRSDSKRNLTPIGQVHPSQKTGRNLRYNQTQYHSMSKDIQSEETNIPIDLVQSARWANQPLKQIDPLQQRAQRSLGPIHLHSSLKSHQSINTRNPSDIRSILEASEQHLRLQSEMAQKRKEREQIEQKNLIQRKNQLLQHQKKQKRDPLATDSLFQPFSQTQSQLQHRHQPTRQEKDAVSQLKDVSRFGRNQPVKNLGLTGVQQTLHSKQASQNSPRSSIKHDYLNQNSSKEIVQPITHILPTNQPPSPDALRDGSNTQIIANQLEIVIFDNETTQQQEGSAEQM